MDEQFEAPHKRKPSFFIGQDSSNHENIMWANGNAWPGGFAAHRVDDGNHLPRREFTIRLGFAIVLRRSLQYAVSIRVLPCYAK
jgi:hypothetical protein